MLLVFFAALAGQPAPVPGPPAAVPNPPVLWDAPPGCPTLDNVQDRVLDLLGRPLRPGELELRGVIAPVGTGWRLSLVIQAGNAVDERTLDADDCGVLGEAAALVAVVMVDPVVAAATIEAEVEPAPAAAPPPTNPRPEPPAIVAPKDEDPPPQAPPPRAGRSPNPFAAFLRVRGGGEFGAVPRGTGGFGLALGLGTAKIRGEVEGSYWIARSVDTANAQARISLGTATARVCSVVTAGPVGIPLCAGVELGGMRATVTAVDGRDATRFWLALQAEAGVRWAFTPRLSLWAAAQVFAPARFPRFVLEPQSASGSEEHVYQPQAAGVRGLVGLEVRLRGVDPPR